MAITGKLHTVRLRWRQQDSLLVWQETELSPGLLDRDGRLQAFAELPSLTRFVRAHRLNVTTTNPRTVDLDGVSTWLSGISSWLSAAEKEGPPPPARLLLDSWHFFRELAAAARQVGRDAEELSQTQQAYEFITWKDPERTLTEEVYDKLFLASRALPLMRSEIASGIAPADTWSREHLLRLVSVQELGLALFQERLGT